MGHARGSDVVIKHFRGGELLQQFYAQRSATLSFGLQEDIDAYLGESSDHVSGTNGPVRLSAQKVLQGTDYVRICEIQKNKNNGDGTDALEVLHATCAVDFGDGQRTRIKLVDGTLTNASLEMSGRTEKVTGSDELVFRTWERIA